MADVTGEEFRTFMKILSSLKVMANAHQELAGIVAEQVELTQAFQVPFYIYCFGNNQLFMRWLWDSQSEN